MLIEFRTGIRLGKASSLEALTGDDLLVWHRLGHAIRIHLSSIAIHDLVHRHALETLLLRHGAILVSQKERLQIDDFFP